MTRAGSAPGDPDLANLAATAQRSVEGRHTHARVLNDAHSLEAGRGRELLRTLGTVGALRGRRARPVCRFHGGSGMMGRLSRSWSGCVHWGPSGGALRSLSQQDRVLARFASGGGGRGST